MLKALMPQVLNRMFHALSQRSKPAEEHADDAFWASTRMLRDLLGICPACKRSLEQHVWARLAEAGPKTDFDQLFLLLKQHHWEALNEIHSFEGTKNAILVKAIRCPQGNGTVVAYADYAELWAAPDRGPSEVLTLSQWAELEHALPDLEWHPF